MMNNQTEFIRALSEFLAVHTEHSAAHLGKLITSFMQATRGVPAIDPSFKEKLVKQIQTDMGGPDGVPSFLQSFFLTHVRHDAWPPHADFIASRYLRRRSGERFLTWQERQQSITELDTEVIPGTELGFRQTLYSQGAGPVFHWRGIPCFKTTNDMAVYMMLIYELQPRTIIELGSGNGGSALLLADLCAAMGLQTQIISVDKSAVEISDPRVTFVQSDCARWLAEATASKREFGRPCLMIEDFHGDLGGFFKKIDAILQDGDYLIIEDSLSKQARIAEVIGKQPYLVDTNYTDFFGVNCTSATNSVFMKTSDGSTPQSQARRERQLRRDQDRAWRQRNKRDA